MQSKSRQLFVGTAMLCTSLLALSILANATPRHFVADTRAIAVCVLIVGAILQVYALVPWTRLGHAIAGAWRFLRRRYPVATHPVITTTAGCIATIIVLVSVF